MLSSEDSRRLAQLDRQLLRDDPDFCARMEGADFNARSRRRVWIPLTIIATLLWSGAVVLAVFDFWTTAVITAVGAAVTTAIVVYRLVRRRSRSE
jgi:fatty acid desaturase